jgi:hypothetical protein
MLLAGFVDGLPPFLALKKSRGGRVTRPRCELTGGGNPTLAIAGNFSTANFQVSTDGTNTTVTVQCFAAGTRIATPDGDIAVEALREGELVRLHDGGAAPVKWIGHRRIDCGRHPAPEQVWPVRVTANAFGPGLPRRDLFLSPDHAAFAAGVLIPVKHLLNGTSIAQIAVAELHYFHVELPSHDVLLAEGLPVESYLDSGDRAKFSGGNVTALHPNFAARAWEMKGCAELVSRGERLDAVRASIATYVRAAMPRVPRIVEARHGPCHCERSEANSSSGRRSYEVASLRSQ